MVVKRESKKKGKEEEDDDVIGRYGQYAGRERAERDGTRLKSRSDWMAA